MKRKIWKGAKSDMADGKSDIGLKKWSKLPFFSQNVRFEHKNVRFSPLVKEENQRYIVLNK